MSFNIRFTEPFMTGNEFNLISDCLTSKALSGGGNYSKRAEEKLSEISNVSATLLTNSCTEALQMAYLLCNLSPGDEVIMPSYNFTSAAAVCLDLNLVPVFADVNASDINLDIDSVKSLISSKTKAIVALNYGGIPADLIRLRDISKSHSLFLIEDNAHGLGTKIDGKAAGSFSDCSTLSFHATKNIQSGEGGALQTSDAEFLNRGHIIREKGTNRKQFLDGEIDKYTWIDKGGSFLPSEYTAAFLCAQLEKFDEITKHRKDLWNLYHLNLQDWAEKNGVGFPPAPSVGTEYSGHIFWLTLPNKELKKSFISHLADSGIQATTHYQSLNSTPAAVNRNLNRKPTPVSEKIVETLVRLPMHGELTENQILQVTETVKSFKF